MHLCCKNEVPVYLIENTFASTRKYPICIIKYILTKEGATLPFLAHIFNNNYDLLFSN